MAPRQGTHLTVYGTQAYNRGVHFWRSTYDRTRRLRWRNRPCLSGERILRRRPFSLIRFLLVSVVACGGVTRDNNSPSDSGAGSVTAAGDAGPTQRDSGSAGAEVRHIMDTPPFGDPFTLCAADGGCPAGLDCFHLSKEVSVCDAPQPATVAQCTSDRDLDPNSPDQCGCDEAECPPDRICVSVARNCACEPKGHNACVEPACSSPADCAGGTVCVPSRLLGGNTHRCLAVSCQSDQECTERPGGKCTVWINYPTQSGVPWLGGVSCTYPP